MSNNTMYKRIGLVQRTKTLSREQFEAHWLSTHAALCKKLPGMRRYSVNLIEPGCFPHLPYDGFSELWFDSEAALESPRGPHAAGGPADLRREDRPGGGGARTPDALRRWQEWT